ncbi:hypothetical protein DXG01_007484 [Tephrocybe rancida]|nr:hypothetical protein DXG01_007484 [Tephrocybe rancida]
MSSSSTPSGNEDTQLLVSSCHAIFLNADLYKEVLKCEGGEAQSLLDAFQWLLDRPELDISFRRHLIVATRRLAKKSNLYPTCYELGNIVQEGQLPIEAGGFADIYKGWFEGQPVCLKAIRVYQTTRVEYLIKISRETILWGQLIHPNVLPFYGIFRVNSRLCFVSPWMEAGDVRTYLTNHPKANRVLLALDVAEGLAYLHENGIVHGDLKGDSQPNILINSIGRARLADFGLSAMSDPQILAWTSVSSAASKGGSVRWQAPELFDFNEDRAVKNTPESDVYACSCVAFEIFTNSMPFAELQRESTIELRIMAGARPTRPSDLSPSWNEWGLTPSIWSLMGECWENDPNNRPKMPQIIVRLRSEPGCDAQLHDHKDDLDPAHFRRRVRNHTVDIRSASARIDHILNRGSPVSDQAAITLHPTIVTEHEQLVGKGPQPYEDKLSPLRLGVVNLRQAATSQGIPDPQPLSIRDKAPEGDTELRQKARKARNARDSEHLTDTREPKRLKPERAETSPAHDLEVLQSPQIIYLYAAGPSSLPTHGTSPEDSLQSINIRPQAIPFPDELSLTSVAPKFRKGGSDWFAVFNPQAKRTLDISLVHNLMHESVLADDSVGKSRDLYIRSVRFSPDGKLLATGAEDQKIRIWDIAKRRIRRVFVGHTQDIYSLDFSLDGRFIISGSGDKTARIWDMHDYSSKVLTINDTDSLNNDVGVTSVAISPSGQLVAAGSPDTVVRIWDVSTGALLERLRGHRDSVYSVEFTPDGRGLVSGSLDKTLKYWDVSALAMRKDELALKKPGDKPSSPCVMDFIGHEFGFIQDYVLSVSVSHDGQWVVSGSKDRCVQFWDIRDATLQFVLQGHKNSVNANSAGNMFATGSGDWSARIWRYNTLP